MAHYLAPLAAGLGDLIVSLPAVHGLIDAGRETYLVIRANVQQGLVERIEGLSGTVSEAAFAKRTRLAGDVFINMRDHALQKDYWWGSPEFDRQFPGVTINHLLKTICSDLGIAANFESLKPLKFKPQKHVFGSVVFVPGSDGSYKCWPTKHWLTLAEMFKQEGIRIIMVGQPESSDAVQELLPFLDWLPTKELPDALDVLSSARAVISVDTGLLHLAVNQGIPTIGLYRSHPVFWRHYLHSFAVTARPCDARCVIESLKCTTNEVIDFSNFNYKSWTCQVPDDQTCMSTLSPQRVFAVAQSNAEIFLGKLKTATAS